MLDYKTSGDTLTITIDDHEEFDEFVFDITDDFEPDDRDFTLPDEIDALDEAGFIGNGLEYTDGEALGHMSQAPVILVDEGAYAYMGYQTASWLTTLYRNGKVEFKRFADYEEVAEILFGD